MAFLSDQDQAQLRQLFSERLGDDVTLVHFTQKASRIVVPGVVPCATCADTLALLEEVAGLSDRLHLEVHDFRAEADLAARLGVDKIPATIVRGKDGGDRVRFFGVPAGYEFSSLIDDLFEAGGSGSPLSADTVAALEGLTQDVHIQVFVTPTCPYCPGAVRLAHALAFASPRVTADMVTANEFPQLSQRHAVMAVPKTVVTAGGTVRSFEGAVPEPLFVEQVLAAAGGGAPATE